MVEVLHRAGPGKGEPSRAVELQSVEWRQAGPILADLSQLCLAFFFFLNHGLTELPSLKHGRIEWKKSREYCQKSTASLLKLILHVAQTVSGP